MKKINENIAKNIKNYMEVLNMEASDLAERIGCAQSTVYMWMQGNATPRMEKIDRMCEVFGCERKDLIADSQASPEEIQQKQIVTTFVRKFKSLSPETQLNLLTHMERLISEQEKEKKNE